MIFQFLSDIILIQLIKNLFRTLQFRLIGLSSAHAGITPPYAMVMEGVHSKGLYELGGINSKYVHNTDINFPKAAIAPAQVNVEQMVVEKKLLPLPSHVRRYHVSNRAEEKT